MVLRSGPGLERGVWLEHAGKRTLKVKPRGISGMNKKQHNLRMEVLSYPLGRG